MQNDQLFFPHNDGDDLEDRYEELLFEDKQFFTTKAIIPKVFRARIERMRKREEAFRRISKTSPSENISIVSVDQEIITDLLENYLRFQKVRSELMKQLYKVHECNSVILLIEQLLEYQLFYLMPWKISEIDGEKDIVISKEPDPSELFNAIKAFSEAGGSNVNEIQTLFFNGKSLLETETKRLSLLLQLEKK